MWDDKSAVKKILDGRRPQYEEGAMEVDGRELAAKAMMDAMKSGDSKAMSEAMSDHHDLHMAMRDESSTSDGTKNENND